MPWDPRGHQLRHNVGKDKVKRSKSGQGNGKEHRAERDQLIQAANPREFSPRLVEPDRETHQSSEVWPESRSRHYEQRELSRSDGGSERFSAGQQENDSDVRKEESGQKHHSLIWVSTSSTACGSGRHSCFSNSAKSCALALSASRMFS